MIHAFCTACFRRGELMRLGSMLYLCALCQDELDELSLRRSERSLSPCYSVASVFAYQGLVRALLIRAKVKGDQRALLLLTALAAAHATCLDRASWAEILVASPSSLWGRLRGRLDVAAHLTHKLGDVSDRPVVAAPAHLQWRRHKRAQMSAQARQEDAPSPRPAWSGFTNRSLARFDRLAKAHAAERFLIIDDVVTSGSTLLGTAAAIARDGRSIRLLTLAAART